MVPPFYHRCVLQSNRYIVDIVYLVQVESPPISPTDLPGTFPSYFCQWFDRFVALHQNARRVRKTPNRMKIGRARLAGAMLAPSSFSPSGSSSSGPPAISPFATRADRATQLESIAATTSPKPFIRRLHLQDSRRVNQTIAKRRDGWWSALSATRRITTRKNALIIFGVVKTIFLLPLSVTVAVPVISSSMMQVAQRPTALKTMATVRLMEAGKKTPLGLVLGAGQKLSDSSSGSRARWCRHRRRGRRTCVTTPVSRGVQRGVK